MVGFGLPCVWAVGILFGVLSALIGLLELEACFVFSGIGCERPGFMPAFAGRF